MILSTLEIVYSETCSFDESIKSIPVITFHSIGDVVSNKDEIAISKTKFSKILKGLKDAWYETITMDYYDRNKSNIFVLIKKPIILTFDDWFKSLYDIWLPEMKKHGFVWISWVITSKVWKHWHMSYKDLAKLQALWYEVSSHTTNHTDLLKNKNKLDIEIKWSILTLRKKWFNSKTFVYPYGKNDKDIHSRLIEAWIKYWFSNENRSFIPWKDNDLSIPRIRVSEKTNIDELYKKLRITQ